MKNHENYIILFDGVCNLCNNSVQFIIKKDTRNKFKFSSLQSSFGQKLLKEHNIETVNTDSFVFIRNDKAYIKSTAALWVAFELGRFWALLCFFFVVPAFLRDRIYDWVARNRYKWFGKKESCMIPTPEIKNKFLD